MRNDGVRYILKNIKVYIFKNMINFRGFQKREDDYSIKQDI